MGDRSSDIECGSNAGIKTILINYNNGKEKTDLSKDIKPNFTTDNFLKACDFIVNDFTGGKTFVE